MILVLELVRDKLYEFSVYGTAPPGVVANLRGWAGEIEQLLPPLATGHLRDINADSSGMVFITGTPYYKKIGMRAD